MLLLTWHGTILRIERESGRLNHARLVPERDLATDFTIHLPPGGLTGPFAGPNDMTLVPGKVPGTANLIRGGTFLCAEPGRSPRFARTKTGPWETLLLVTDEAVAVLRDLLCHAWVRQDTGGTVHPADIGVSAGMVLRAADMSVKLSTHMPFAGPGDTVTIPHDQGMLHLRRVAGSRVVVREMEICAQPPGMVPDVADEAAFRTRSPARLTLPAGPEIGFPPILGSQSDRDFVYARGWRGLPPASGPRQLNSQVVRDTNKFVLLGPGFEGMILDEAGVSNEAAYTEALAAAGPPHFGREGNRTFIDRKLLDEAPFLAGPHVVFYPGDYQDYYQWLIGAMIPLSLIEPFLPPGAALLLPGSLAQFRAAPVNKLDHVQVLEAFGFGCLPRVEVPGQICRVEEVYWPARCGIGEIPAGALRSARDRVLAGREPASGPKRRIYVKRAATRGVTNDTVVETILGKHGFVPVIMEDLTVSAQIDIFRHAEMVVAAHGAALANLLFCSAGTKVLELSPTCEYRPFFNEISAKLGLIHAILPCATNNTTFNGRLLVHPKRLECMLTMLLCQQAAEA